jgi:hypothetical protein
MKKANPQCRWHISSQEREQIRRLTLAGVRQSVIARKLKIGAPSVSKAQRTMGLPTVLVWPEEKIMKLFRAGWPGYKISKFLGVPSNRVFETAHKNKFRRADGKGGYRTDPQAEAQLIEALKRREDYAIRLARKYKVGICKTKRLAHEVLATREFRPGACKPVLSSAYPQKHFDVQGQ